MCAIRISEKRIQAMVLKQNREGGLGELEWRRGEEEM